MILIPLALLLASAASASTDTLAGFDTPAFWTKAYAIPHSYCQHRLVAEAPEINTRIASAIACPPDKKESRTGDVYAICRISEAKIEESILAVKRATKTVFEKKDCVAVPDYPELSYKARHLEEEYSALKLSSETTPGLMGLYDAQMKALEIIQEKHERAKTATLEVFVSTGGRCTGSDCDGFLASRWESSQDWQAEMRLTHDGFKPWSRSKYPSCLQVQAVRVFLDFKDGTDEAAEVKRTLTKLGEPYSEAGCSRTGSPVFMVFSHKSLKKVIRATLDLPSITHWGRSKSREANTRTDDQRGEILDRELKALNLTAAPHLKALAIAERERVKESGEAIRKLNSGVLVVASFEGK